MAFVCRLLLISAFLVLPRISHGADDKSKLPAGHLSHGEAFNEGPRQRAYLMGGTGKINFTVTTKNKEAQAFINQGVGQLHGFWNFEAERSFRQAASIDPDCAMAYWGMATANINNSKRGKGFIAEAVKRKGDVTERERLYIEAVDAYIKAGAKKNKDRSQKYTKSFERILYKYPDDIDAKAFLALRMWSNRGRGIPVSSYLAVDALLQQVFEVEPMHPCHHYRIHLWDGEKPGTAVSSAARCGQASPGIAHMWHMPGHIFSKLKRYNDAAWQQEASARVDHAHMIRDRVLPDRISNFAHNNEWLIRNLNNVGRIHDAVDLAKNMIELPRHPKYNTATRGSSNYGRMRLFQVLSKAELWSDLIQLADTMYLEPTTVVKEQDKRLRFLGRAYFHSGDVDKCKAQLALLEDRLKQQKEAQSKAEAAAEKKARAKFAPKQPKKDATKKDESKKDESKKDESKKDEPKKDEPKAADKKPATETVKDKAAEAKRKAAETKRKADEKKAVTKARADARRRFTARVNGLQTAVNELKALLACNDGDFKTGLPLLKKVRDISQMHLARRQLKSGDKIAAEKTARDFVNRRQKEVLPLANLVDILWQCDKRDAAAETFKQLRGLSTAIDMDIPVFARLAPIAAELKFPEDWHVVAAPKDDIGERPELDSLGPFRWHPSAAGEWTLKDHEEKAISLADYRGKPVVVIFYLGYGCLHCAEQLQAFAPKTKEFEEAGISIVAISTDTPEDLTKSVTNYEKGEFPFPLVSNSKLDIFKAYRAFDDFETSTLHGTFLVDSEGKVRWQDISYEPFMKPDFVLNEAKRLLGPSKAEAIAQQGTPAEPKNESTRDTK